MLVVSKFHDYYDGLASQGIDKSLVYVRHTKDSEFVELPSTSFTRNETHEKNGNKIELNARVIAIVFCGKPYYYWRGEVKIFKNPNVTYIDQVFYRDNKDTLFAAMRAIYGLGEPKQKSWNWRSYLFTPKKDDRVTFKEAFENFDWNAVHFKLKCPVLIIRPVEYEEEAAAKLPKRDYRHDTRWYRVVENPVLKDYGFERHVDPFSAWQEITMYMGGVLGQPDRVMYQLNDVEKRDKAGFDKWSFKKMPSKKH